MFESLYLQFLFGGLVSLVTMTNPLSKVPLFVSLTRDMTARRRARQAKWACLYAAGIMSVCLLAGNIILSVFGISYGALRVAGGFVVVILGYRMLFSLQLNTENNSDNLREDFSFFPIAMPGISGPGTIAVVIGISTEIAELPDFSSKVLAFIMTLSAIFATSFCMWLVLHSSLVISEKLGHAGCEVMTRLMGFLLICVGVEFIGSGVRIFMAGN